MESDNSLLLKIKEKSDSYSNSDHASQLQNNILNSKLENTDLNDFNSIDSIWERVCEILKPKIDKQIYGAWFHSLEVKGIEFENKGDSIICKVSLSFPNKFCVDHIKRNYSTVIEECFSKCLGCDAYINFEVNPKTTSNKESLNKKISTVDNKNEKSPKSIVQKTTESRLSKSHGTTNLNSAYNFSNFVIGSCNQFAHAACIKVSENPGTSYNPLLIYGGVGLGKTHLANAIGNAAHRRKKKVIIVSSETFVSELIGCLRTNTMDKFKNKFRSLDILIIDDIQFIIGKERTQEEFFHTFNELYGKKKQIIITSDKLPQELTGLEERLRTRFASGLSVDLQVPDFETRVAILIKKGELCGIEVPYEVARIIASRIDTNVRELEGALTRLQALCSLLGEKPSSEMAQKVVDTIAPSKNKEMTTDAIKQVVAKQFNVSINDLTGKRRTQNIAHARQVAMFLCRRHTARSFPEIGALFGGRDHSTVIHAIKCVNERLNSDEILKEQIGKITSILEK